MSEKPNPLDRLELTTMALALIAASEQCSRLVPGSNPLHWRMGFAAQAVAQKHILSEEGLLTLLDDSYPEPLLREKKGES